MDSKNQITYQVIIDYLKEKSVSFNLGSSKKKKLHNIDFVYYGLPDFSSELDYFLASLIFSINKEKFLDEEDFGKKIVTLNKYIKEETKYMEIIKLFKINVFIITDDELYVLPNSSIIDIYQPHIIFYYNNGRFYPCTIDNQEILFHNEENSFIYSLYEKEPKIFQNLIENYQILDEVTQSIDNFLGIEEDCFINESEVDNIENLSKLKKAELIELILTKQDYKKSSLNKMKKVELIKLLN